MTQNLMTLTSLVQHSQMLPQVNFYSKWPLIHSLGFLSMHSHALLMLESKPVAQIWDVEQAVCLRTLARGFQGSDCYDIRFALDDTFFLEARPARIAMSHMGHELLFWSASTDTATRGYWQGVNCFCLSPDECTPRRGFFQALKEEGELG